MKVVFFPRNDYPNNVEVCTHRLGKKMTFSEGTTMIPPLVSEKLLPYIVGLNQSSNIRVSGFFDNRNTITDYVMQQIANDVISPDVYFLPSPYLPYPSSGEVYSDEKMQAGKEILWPWFIDKFGKYPKSVVYGNSANYIGNWLKPYILAGNGETIVNATDYGIGVGNPNNVPYSIDNYYKRNRNRRSLDYAIINNEDYAGYIEWTASLIDSTMALPKGGFIVSFNHWHNLLALDYNSDGTPKEGRNDYAIENGFKPYFNMLAQKNANDEIYFAGYGEAVAYLAFRQMIAKIVMYSPIGNENDKLVIRLEANNSLNIAEELLQTPISVKFSTSGTPLEGQTIISENNLISLGNNQYIVEIPYSQYGGAVIEKVSI